METWYTKFREGHFWFLSYCIQHTSWLTYASALEIGYVFISIAAPDCVLMNHSLSEL